MSEISSGLVAVAWMAADEGGDLEFNTINKFSCGRIEGTPLVRLSDAEAKLSECVTSYEKEVAGLTAELNAKDEEIERLEIESTAINDTIEALGFANREIERLTTSENDWITCHAKIWRELQETKTIVGNQAERISDLEASPISEEVIDILRSKIKALESEILEQCRINGMGAECEAALLGKVAQQSAALKLAREALFDMQDSYAAVHGWKDSFVIAATTAIAAIDSLQKGE